MDDSSSNRNHDATSSSSMYDNELNRYLGLIGGVDLGEDNDNAPPKPEEEAMIAPECFASYPIRRPQGDILAKATKNNRLDPAVNRIMARMFRQHADLFLRQAQCLERMASHPNDPTKWDLDEVSRESEVDKIRRENVVNLAVLSYRGMQRLQKRFLQFQNLIKVKTSGKITLGKRKSIKFSGRNLFDSEHYTTYNQENDGNDKKAFYRKILDKWNSLTDDEKAEYNRRAAEIRKEREDYQNQQRLLNVTESGEGKASSMERTQNTKNDAQKRKRNTQVDEMSKMESGMEHTNDDSGSDSSDSSNVVVDDTSRNKIQKVRSKLDDSNKSMKRDRDDFDDSSSDDSNI